MFRSRSSDSPELFTWDVDHACGVTDDQGRARELVRTALDAAPAGTRGVVERVRVSESGRGSYVLLGEIARAHRDERSGSVVWTTL
ncbi:hypothetical protein [Actinomadura xylanilytica]|uniref:hypothetical protein n=1 Tax=Actinomadura xylanilytica TaxID=887459 RepID=UPI00255A7F79|nr:hypothetical protein [Actinomadura xylanilytica]MDL4772912.1 hypothetical protein [Actinomadura xylanilytica]